MVPVAASRLNEYAPPKRLSSVRRFEAKFRSRPGAKLTPSTTNRCVHPLVTDPRRKLYVEFAERERNSFDRLSISARTAPLTFGVGVTRPVSCTGENLLGGAW